MSNLLEKYVDADDTLTEPARKPYSETELALKRQKKLLKLHKSLKKALRKQNRLMKQEAERRKAEEAAAEAARLKAEEEAKEANKRKSASGVRGFLTKLGDAICKAIPKILTTLATLAFSWFVKNKLDRRVPQST